MQENRCFYCGSAMKQDPHVDHFIPWSRYPRDIVLDDQPAALQVARWA
jgi:5-methylcytosine-specific restriction endonuclease McrA